MSKGHIGSNILAERLKPECGCCFIFTCDGGIALLCCGSPCGFTNGDGVIVANLEISVDLSAVLAIHGHKDIVASSIRQIEVYCCPTLHGSGRQEFGTLRHGVFVVDVQGVGITGEFGSAHAGTDHTGCSPILVAAHSLYGESILDDLVISFLIEIVGIAA